MSETTATLDELLAHASWLRGLARALVGETGADDLVQEVWLRAAHQPPARLDSPRGWLKSVLRSIHLRWLERGAAARRRERDYASSAADTLPSAAEMTGRAEAQRLLVDAVLALDEPYRRTLLLHFFDGHSAAALARRDGEPASTVRNRIARGVALLRARLDARPGGRESWIAGIALLAVPEVGTAGVAAATITLGSITMWKAAAATLAAASVLLLAWLGRSMFDDGAELTPFAPSDDRPTATNVATGGDGAASPTTADPTTAPGRVAAASDVAARTDAIAEPTVLGRVVGPDGVGIAGARVEIADGAGDATTDATGQFTVSWTPPLPDSIEFVATAAGFVVARDVRVLQTRGDGRFDLGVVELDRGVELRGTIVDATGVVVDGAELRLLEPQSARIESTVTEPEGAPDATSTNGAFALAAIPIGPWRLRVDHPSHPPTIVDGETRAAGNGNEPIEIRLPRGGIVTGRITGLPADATDVLVVGKRRSGGDGTSTADIHGVRRVTPEPNGTFALRGLLLDTDYEVLVAAADDPRGVGEALSNRITTTANGEPIVLSMRGAGIAAPTVSNGAWLRFRAVDAVTGEPIRRYETAYRDGLRGLLGSLSRGVVEAPDGRSEFRDLGIAEAEDGAALRIRAPGYRFFELGGLALPAGRITDLGDVALEPAPRLRVRVVDDATSAPIEDATLTFTGYPMRRLAPRARLANRCTSCHGARAGRAGVARSSTLPNTCYPLYQQKVYRPFESGGTTDANGVASIELFDDVAMTAKIEHDGHVDVELERARFAAGQTLEVRMPNGGSVVVRVLEANGEPTAGLSVTCDGAEALKTNARGEVRFEQIAPGEHTFTATRKEVAQQMFVIGNGSAPRRLSSVEDRVRVRVGEEARLTLQLLPANGLVGTVAERGAPLAGATVRLESTSTAGGAMVLNVGPNGPTDDSVRTRSDGSFEFDDVEIGDYALVVTHPARAMPDRVPVRIGVGDNRTAIDLPLTIVEGIVRDRDGQPLAGARVTARDPAAAPSAGQAVAFQLQTINADGTIASSSGTPKSPSAATDENGRFTLRGVAAGVSLVVVATTDDGRTGKTRTAALALDERRTGLDIRATASGTLRLQVAAERGGFFEAFPVVELQRFVDGRPLGEPRTVRGRGGTAVVADLAPGAWRVQGTLRTGERTAAQTVTVIAGRTQSLMLTP